MWNHVTTETTKFKTPITDSFDSGRESHPLSFRLLRRYVDLELCFRFLHVSISMMIILNNLTTVDIATSKP